MSQNPKQIWQRLSAKEKEKILIELISICRESTNEQIKQDFDSMYTFFSTNLENNNFFRL